MSVINKMLRDLDERHSDGSASKTGRSAGVTWGTVPLAEESVMVKPASMLRRGAWGGGLLLVLAASGGVWYEQTAAVVSKPAQPLAVAPSMVTSANPVPVPTPTPTPTPTLVTSEPESALLATTVAVLPTPIEEIKPPLPATANQPKAVTAKNTIQTKRIIAPTKIAPSNKLLTDPVVQPQFLRMDMTLSKTPSVPSLNAAPTAVVRPVADALAQAQSLWHAGSRVAAMELLQQALSKVEASSAVALPVTGSSALAQLARELARMNLAEGQVHQALALLTRLEPQLSQIAEVWAMRGNAAQRLGQHADAVKSYKQALLLKPDEPRWMTGQAVSLAAQGQLTAAGDLAEKARVLGGLRPEIASYLRQLGVAVRVD